MVWNEGSVITWQQDWSQLIEHCYSELKQNSDTIWDSSKGYHKKSLVVPFVIALKWLLFNKGAGSVADAALQQESRNVKPYNCQLEHIKLSDFEDFLFWFLWIRGSIYNFSWKSAWFQLNYFCSLQLSWHDLLEIIF